MIFCHQKEVNNIKHKTSIVATIAKKAAENALRRDANRTTCVGIYQPKAPTELKRFKNSK